MGGSGFSSAVWRILACPFCGTRIDESGEGQARCPTCEIEYTGVDESALDLRLRAPKHDTLTFELGERAPDPDIGIATLNACPEPQVDFGDIDAPHHLTPELMSYFPKARERDSLALDLGCGDGAHRAVCERAGFEYVGLDYSAARAPLRGDAHALPFLDESFEFVLSIAVLEHVRYPFVMMKEAHRVLQPGGRLIGTVAFLEPFHDQSLYHHSHLGVLNTLRTAHFRVDRIAPSEAWSVFAAQAEMAGFPHLRRWQAKMLMGAPVRILNGVRRLAAALGKRADEGAFIARNTGAFSFVATRTD